MHGVLGDTERGDKDVHGGERDAPCRSDGDDARGVMSGQKGGIVSGRGGVPWRCVARGAGEGVWPVEPTWRWQRSVGTKRCVSNLALEAGNLRIK